jgi:hypothetical protein
MSLIPRPWLAVITAAALASLGPCVTPAPAGAAGPALGIASSLMQVRPSTAITGMPTSVSLTAARGETESFQIVIPGPTTVTSVTGNPFGWSSTDVFAARVYTATDVSDHEGGTGDWFDALVPAVDRIYGETRNAFPLTVPAGQNRVVWVDVTVPTSVPAGTYTSSLTVTTAAGSTVVPMSMRVLGLTYPATSSMTSAFFMNYDSGSDDQICLAHTGSATCNGSAATRRLLYSLYSRMALDNRVTIANGSGLRADQSPAIYGPDWETYAEAPAILGTTTLPAGARWVLRGARATSVMSYEYASWHCGATCVGQYRAEATEAGQDWSSLASYYACDEPNTNAAEWSACATKASEAVTAWKRPTVVTASMRQYQAYWPASGMPPITTLVPLILRMHDKTGQVDAGDQRASYDSFLATPGNKLWLYTSCIASGCGGPDPAVDNSTYFDGWPGYAIDAPANQARAMGWMVRRYRASGELNWGVNVRLATAWQAGGLYRDGMNGDGTYFYPGTVAQIGGSHDIPLASIRLKRLRDGREDYELMTWLSAHGQSTAVDAIVKEAYPAAYSATASADDTATGKGAVSRGRDKLIALVDQMTGARQIAFASNRTGNYDIFTMAPDGSGVTQLTTAATDDRFPAWKPGGSMLAYSNGGDIWTMNADGSNKVNLTADIGDWAERPAWDATGANLVFVRKVAGHWEVWRMAASGAAKTALVTYAATGADNYDPVVRSSMVYFVKAERIFRVPLAGGTPAAVITGTAIDEVPDVGETRLTWSRSAGGPYDIEVSGLTGAGAVNLTATSTGGPAINDLHSSLSPDEGQIVFASTNGGDLEIWRIGANGTGAVPLTSNTAIDTDPDWAGY